MEQDGPPSWDGGSGGPDPHLGLMGGDHCQGRSAEAGAGAGAPRPLLSDTQVMKAINLTSLDEIPPDDIPCYDWCQAFYLARY